MGFGVSGATAIVFLGLFVCAGTIYTATAGTAERIHEAHDESREHLLDRKNTAITVTDATFDSTNETLNVSVENDGATTLSVNATTLLVDNEYRAVENATVDGGAGTDIWAPGQVLELTVTASGPSIVKVITEAGVAGTETVVEA